METIRIKCPNCGAILTVADDPSNYGKSVKCPVCKEKHLFADFKAVKPIISDEEDKTRLGTGLSTKDETVLPNTSKTVSIGYLWDESSRKKYTLTEGVNLVGRMTYQMVPLASVPIETEDRGFSRKHIFIEVIRGADGIVRYYAYNASNKNITTINGVQINEEDKMILHNGDIIKSSSAALVFRESEISFSQHNDSDNDKTKL